MKKAKKKAGRKTSRGVGYPIDFKVRRSATSLPCLNVTTTLSLNSFGELQTGRSGADGAI